MADIRRNLGIPSGVVFPFAGTAAPYGYLVCDGSAISRTDYPQLFASLGTSHGIGDGSTTFNLPDYRGRFLRGVDAGSGNDPDAAGRVAVNGGNGGDAVGSAQGDAMQGHWHSMGGVVNSADTANEPVQSLTGSTGSGNPVNSTLIGRYNIRAPITDFVNGTPRTSAESRPKNANVNYIIKV
jgi:microcystin-dependent protein